MYSIYTFCSSVKRDDDDDDGGEHHESSPEPLPPGVEMEHKTETDMPVPPTLSSQTEGGTYTHYLKAFREK